MNDDERNDDLQPETHAFLSYSFHVYTTTIYNAIFIPYYLEAARLCEGNSPDEIKSDLSHHILIRFLNLIRETPSQMVRKISR